MNRDFILYGTKENRILFEEALYNKIKNLDIEFNDIINENFNDLIKPY